MREIIHVGTTSLGHSFATTLLTQNNPDIIVIDEVHHYNEDITEQLINPYLKIEDIQQFEQEENMKSNLGLNALADAMLAGSMGDNEIAQKYANGNVIPHGKLRPINTDKRRNRYDGSNPQFKTQYNKSK